MRLAATEKLGFYPATPEAIDGLAKHLRLVSGKGKADQYFILDPCAGEGAAIKQLADSMGVIQKNVHAIELDRDRGASMRVAMPSAQVLAPCSLFQTNITGRSFSLIYCNPPFDYCGLGSSGREETRFVQEAWSLLADGGIMVVVAPLTAYVDNREFVTVLDNHFKDAVLYRFPEPIYNEVIMIAKKRNTPSVATSSYQNDGPLAAAYHLAGNGGYSRGGFDYDRGRRRGINSVLELPPVGTACMPWEDGHPVKPPVRPMTKEQSEKWTGDEMIMWEVHPAWRPSRFVKGMYTDQELIEVVTESPLNQLWRETKEPPIQESPLPLAEGHVALLVTSGALDGLLETPHGNHVMRGIGRKREEFNEEASSTKISEDGKTCSVKEVYSETSDTKIRAVDKDHVIFTYTMEPRTIEGLERHYEMGIEPVEGCEGEDVVDVVRRNGVDHVTARLNDEIDVEFMLDTGAGGVMISGDTSSALQLMRTGDTMHCSDANGQTTELPRALINSLQIGRFVIKNLRCIVHDKHGPEFDPLLGQTVLRLFNYTYNQSESTLTLSLANK